MTERIRVGLVGLAGTGKTSLAEHWAKKYGFGKLSFAAAVKEVVATLRLDPNREHHQAIGDGIRKLVGPDVWINVVDEKLKIWKGSRIVIDDVRYSNEVTFLQSRGFKILKLERPEEDRLRDRPEMLDPKLRNHKSETDLISLHGSGIDELYAVNLGELFKGADKWLDGLLAASPLLSVTKEDDITKQEVIHWIRAIVSVQLAIIEAPIDPNLMGQGLKDAKAEKQKASRIIIQIIRAASAPGVGLEKALQENILSILARNEKMAVEHG